MILPRPDASFEWRDTRFGPVLVCGPLARIAAHQFTTRAWSLGQPDYAAEAWDEVAAAFEPQATRFVRLRQVHGRDTVTADLLETGSATTLPEADIVVCGDPSCAVAVQGADCVPLLIVDRRLGVVAAAHAGWRGLALGVPRVAVEALTSTYGSSPSDLVAAIGPSVGACCYEVGPDVREAFVANGVEATALARWFLDAPSDDPDNPPMPGLPAERRPGHAYFDGWANAADQLRWAGLQDAHVFTARICTASHPAVLCSYRRDGRRSGRIAAAIRASGRP